MQHAVPAKSTHTDSSNRIRVTALRSAGLLVVPLREREVRELRAPLAGLDDLVVRILAAVPVVQTQGAVLVRHVLVHLTHVPRLDECLGIVHPDVDRDRVRIDRKSTRLNSSHTVISYAVFCL